nr:hypothetical protein [Tanacetum cinerariifolium]
DFVMDFSGRSYGCFVIMVVMIIGLNGVCVCGENDGDSVGAPMVKTEQEALYYAIQGFVGQWWNGSDLYPDPCGWTPIQGVSCDVFDGIWYVTELNIGKIPESYGNLKELLIMDLSRNKLTGNLPFTFGGLTSILKFDLSKNKLEGEIPTAISNLKNLILLDLSNNNISGGFDFANQEMSSLEELLLSNNPISGDLMKFNWKNVNKLVALDLSNTGLTGEIPESIAVLRNLRFLGLNDNSLSGNISPKIAELANLSAFYVHGNNLTGDLKFPKEFYQKMGRRFGAWNNSNLCFPVTKMAESIRPFGVKIYETTSVELT